MISELQQEKLTHYFNVLDTNHDGILERKDFLEIGRILATLWGLQEDSEEYERLLKNCSKSWDDFVKLAGEHADRAHLDEWLMFADHNIVNAPDEKYRKYIGSFVGDLLEIFDENQDGYLSIDEYTDFFMAYHIDIKYSAKAFTKLDRNSDDLISKGELLKAFSEFFRSDDEDAPGNWIFGNWKTS